MPRLHKQDKSMTSWNSSYDDDFFSDYPDYDYDYGKLLALMQPQPNMQLLDIACANGDVLAIADYFGINATGIEITPEAAAVSQKNAPQAKVVVGSSQEIPFDNEQFDLVTCFDVTDFFTNPDGGMGEIFRVLKTGGKACIVLPNADYKGLPQKTKDDYIDYEVFYPLETWKNMLEAKGLIVTAIRFNRPLQPVRNPEGDWIAKIKDWFSLLLLKLFPKLYASQFICICQKVVK